MASTLSDAQKVSRYTVYLDKPASTRWNRVVDDHKPYIQQAVKEIDAMFAGVTKTVASYVLEYASQFGYVLYNDELEAIAERAEVKLGDLIMLQLAYEMFACCTCAVFNINDQPIHVRTMDWDMPVLKKLTVEIEFKNENKTVFLATTWAGYVGVLTGMIPGICSVALNYRKTGDDYFSNFMRAIRGKWPASFLIRKVLETCDDYNIIIQNLSNSQLIAPCYLIICGLKHCKVITRDRDKEVKQQKPSKYVIQTNNDYDTRTNNRLYSNERRDLSKKIIKNIKTFDYDDITKQFWKFPIINEITVYFTIMNPKTGYMMTKITA